MKDKIRKAQERVQHFVDKNKRGIIAGSLLVTMGVSSLLGFAGGAAMEQKAHDNTKEKLDLAIGRINELTEEDNEKSAQIEELFNEREALIKQYEDAMKAMSGSPKEFQALVNSKISILANLVETKEYSQAHRVNVNNAVIELNGLINNASSMSEADKQSLLDLVETLEHKYALDNIVSAWRNNFEYDAVKITVTQSEKCDQYDYQGEQKLLVGDVVTLGVTHTVKADGDAGRVFKSYPNAGFEACDVDISQTGKITDPRDYHFGEFYGLGVKSEMINMLDQLKSFIWDDVSYDVGQDCYSGTTRVDDVNYTFEFDIEGNNLESYSVNGQGDDGYQLIGKNVIEGVPQVIFEQQLATVTKILEEAKALSNTSEKGE